MSRYGRDGGHERYRRSRVAEWAALVDEEVPDDRTDDGLAEAGDAERDR